MPSGELTIYWAGTFVGPQIAKLTDRDRYKILLEAIERTLAQYMHVTTSHVYTYTYIYRLCSCHLCFALGSGVLYRANDVNFYKLNMATIYIPHFIKLGIRKSSLHNPIELFSRNTSCFFVAMLENSQTALSLHSITY